MTEAEKWMVAGMIIGLLLTFGALVISIIALNKKAAVEVSPQPLDVNLVEQFASRREFLEHVRDNDKQRAILHKRLDEAIRDYNEKFQSLPNELVALLRNTGVIK